MTDTKLVVAEMRAGDLLCALQAAVNAEPHWRRKAQWLLRSIERLELPEQSNDRLRELDYQRKAAEILADCI